MPKIWLCLFFGYNGSPFNGMQYQIQTHTITIQGVLAEKLYKKGLIVTQHHGNLQKNQRWSRAARTDKGVHAIINGISCQFIVDDIYYNQDKTLNKNHLDLAFRQAFQDSQLTYHCFKRVTNRFEIRHMIKSRYYSYLCPKIMIDSSEKDIKQQGQSGERKDQAKRHEQILNKLNACCKQFVGTHNFHNYSKNLKAKDPQAQRYILSFKCDSFNKDYYIFQVEGQSFIYHQIRKMVGSIIMVMVNNYPSSFIQNTFFKNQIHMPLAPAQGLFLKGINFGGYNKKKDIPQLLTFDELKSVDQLKKQILDYVTSKDMQNWRQWLIKLRQSIYHGIVFQQDQKEQGKQINDQ